MKWIVTITFLGLRQRSESLRLIGFAMFGATFNLDTRTVIFGTLKDGSLQINNLASNNHFSYRNLFKKWRQRFVKYG